MPSLRLKQEQSNKEGGHKMNHSLLRVFILLIILTLNVSCSKDKETLIDRNDLYPWCIVAFDSLERSPHQRISMLKDLQFDKYAYDGNKTYLDGLELELALAQENQIEVTAVWFWLNAKRDSLHQLSQSNERLLSILEQSEVHPTLWVSFNNNFFKDQSHETSLKEAIELISMIYEKATKLGSKVALYNHGGWFGDPDHMVEIIRALPEYELSIVYNFHHAQEDLTDLPRILKLITPYLSAVNLNGVTVGGPKILAVGAGELERQMVQMLLENGYNGPWGVLGHIKHEDVRIVLERNLEGIRTL